MIHLLQMIHPGTVSMKVRKTKIVTTLYLAAEKRKENKTYSKFKPVKSIKVHSTKHNAKIWYSEITAHSCSWKPRERVKKHTNSEFQLLFNLFSSKFSTFSVWLPKKMRENKRH